MAFRLIPREEKFFGDFLSMADELQKGAQLLEEMLAAEHPIWDKADEIKEVEHKCDFLTHEIIQRLNRTFVTPLDRDDMYRLITVIDDVCDYIDEAADNIDAYEVQEIPAKAREQADVIYRAASRLHEAVELLEGFKDSTEQLFALRELEDEGDQLQREAIAELFRAEQDPLVIIRWKDIHQQLEDAVDACENAADVLEAILVKNR